MKLYFIGFLFFLTALSSCNLVGKKINSFALENSFINASDSIKLKKGDKLGIWFAYKSSVFGDPVGDKEYEFAYQLSNGNKQIIYKKISKKFSDEPKINTSYHLKKDGDEPEAEEGFQQLADEINIAEDGVYTVAALMKTLHLSHENKSLLSNEESQVQIILRRS